MKVLVSGGYDPVHSGHLRQFEEAAKYGEVVVALNSDRWLERKKGFRFFSWEERKEILLSLKWVSEVIPVDDEDGTVIKAIKEVKPSYFAKGGDRTDKNTPEIDVCNELGVEIIWECGGGKIQSSSEVTQRSWGFYQVLYENEFKVKILNVLPGKSTSLQKHQFRNEHWIFPESNEHQFIRMGQEHVLFNDSNKLMKVVEVQTGTYFGEDDIIRIGSNSPMEHK